MIRTTTKNATDDIALRLRSHETEGVTSSDRYHLRNEAAAEIDKLREEVKALKGFADLWYFAMDSAPGDFERIVTTCQPAHWMNEIAKVRRGER